MENYVVFSVIFSHFIPFSCLEQIYTPVSILFDSDILSILLPSIILPYPQFTIHANKDKPPIKLIICKLSLLKYLVTTRMPWKDFALQRLFLIGVPIRPKVINLVVSIKSFLHLRELAEQLCYFIWNAFVHLLKIVINALSWRGSRSFLLNGNAIPHLYNY